MQKQKNKLILGFVGFIASGKGMATKYLAEKYNSPVFRFSTMLRDMLARIYIEPTRDNLIKISEFVRGNFGEDIMAKTIQKDVTNSDSNIVVVEGIRRMADIEYLQSLPNFILTEIEATPEIRYERLIKRKENADDTTKTYEEFLADHERSTEITIKDVVKNAREKIDNNGNFEELYEQLDKLVQKYS